MRNIFILVIFLNSVIIGSAQIGEFETALDIGNPKVKGASTYNPITQEYTLKGGGYNIWFDHDEFHFLFKKLTGDFILTANFKLIGNDDGNAHRKTGWMIRNSTDHDAVSANSCVHGDGLAVLQWRLMRGAYMRDPKDEIFFPKQYFGETIIQLQRVGKQITMRIAHPGLPLEEIGSAIIPEMTDEVLVGPYALAHDPEDIQEVKVWNVQVVQHVPPDWHPNPLVETISHDTIHLTSCIEQININTLKRKVLYQSKNRLSAPFYDDSGKHIYVLQGENVFELSKDELSPLDTGNTDYIPARQSKGKFEYYSSNTTFTNQLWRKRRDKSSLSNQITFEKDHIWHPHLSPDGKWVAYLSLPHDSNPLSLTSYERVSIKIWPTEGGAPKTIAYFYGGKGSFDNYAWSADSNSLLFVSRK